MDASLLALPVLALVDSTSFGTLLIPIWLLTQPQVLARQHLLYLGVVSGIYWALGLALAFGLSALWNPLRELQDTTPVSVVQLALGLALLVFAVLPRRWRPTGRPGRKAGFRDRVLGSESSWKPLVALALVAVAIEAGTMLPYLAAVALLTAADLSVVGTGALLAGYCLVMVLPALLLLALRRVAAHRVEPVLRRVNGWASKAGGQSTLWIAFVVGVLLARDAALRLGLLGS